LEFEYGQRNGREDTRQHAPVKAPRVETPPVPFQEVSRDITTIKTRHDPLEDSIDVAYKKPQNDPGEDDHYTCEVIHGNSLAIGSIWVDVFQVDVIHEIGLCRIECTGERAHKGAEQASQNNSHQADGKEIVDGGRQDLFEVCSGRSPQVTADGVI